MSRIPKFRTWNIEQKAMVPDITLPAYGMDRHMNKIIEEQSEYFVFLQYTGLKDKNGVEIYEGDIVNLDRGHWNNCKPGKCAPHPIDTFAIEWADVRDDIEVCMVGFYAGWASEPIEVIGNIYENPELLK